MQPRAAVFFYGSPHGKRNIFRFRGRKSRGRWYYPVWQASELKRRERRTHTDSLERTNNEHFPNRLPRWCR
jgi:hypothetical protein